MEQFGSGLVTFTVRHRVTPSVPPGRVVAANDAGPAMAAARRNRASGLGLFIEYRDSSGEVSARRIGCRRYDPGHDTIGAWCFERAAYREFRVDRIEVAACTETGELFDLAELVSSLHKRGLPTDDIRLGKILLMLTYLMRCDGEAHWQEREALERAVTGFALRFDGDDAIVDQGLRLVNTLAPDGTDFRRTLRWLIHRRDGPVLARFLRSQAAAVIEADGRVQEDEVRFGAELKAVLDRVIARES